MRPTLGAWLSLKRTTYVCNTYCGVAHSLERAPPVVPALAESPLEFIDCRPGTSWASQARADRPLRAFAQAPGQPDNGRMPL